jgi:DegV family protein with EDD domain
MTTKVAIVTDSISCLTRELIDAYSIGIVPIMLLVQGRVYRDMFDMTPSEAYQMFIQDPDCFATSPSSPGHYLEAYQQASTLADSILCITLSSHLSTGYEMARVAREQALTTLPSTNVEVMDSLNVTAAEGFVVLAAARAAAEGMSLEDVIKAAETVRDTVTFIILLDTL